MGGFQPLTVATVCSLALGGGALAIPDPAFGQETPAGRAGAASRADEVEALRAELAEARAQIAEQNRKLAEQQRRLDLFEQRLSGLAQTTQQIRDEVAAAPPGPASAPPLASDGSAIRVGEPPKDSDRPPTVAVLDQQGSVVTRKGELFGELGLDYTRSDRNRAIFRGINFPEALLIGVFDINENRQDIISASGSLRYGLTNRLEIGVRVPVLYRSDTLITAPIAGSTNNDPARTINSSTNGWGIGDIEVSARYQINNGGRNRPFLIANLQASIPTGRDPFSVRRENGSARESATGAGFWGITPGITAILPSEPAVLFGTIGYTFNLPRNVDTRFPPVVIDRVDPGDQLNFAAGIGLALNDRTSLNFGYSHAWTFSTQTVVRQLDDRTGAPVGAPFRSSSRDLQIGRLLLGVSHKFTERFQVNWSFEIGATDDAPDMRTSLRVPIRF